MRLGVICNLVAHTGAKPKFAPVFEFGLRLAFDTKQDVLDDTVELFTVAHR
jgi:hypothetical protein